MIGNRFTKILVAISIAVSATLIYAATDVKNDASLSTSLISYWEMEETSGVRYDSHSSNDLNDYNTVLYATGIQGNAADFERNNSEYLDISSAIGNSTDDFTYSFWVKFESLPTSGSLFQLFCHTIENGASDAFYQMDLYNGSGTYYLRTFDIRENVAQYTWSGLSTGVWYHIVYVVDYNTASTGQRIYINGSSVATGTCGTVNSAGSTGSGFTLGRYYNHLSGTSLSRYYDGLIDEVGLWNRVLDSTDVSALYNSGSGIPYDAGGGGGAVNYGYGPQVMWFE